MNKEKTTYDSVPIDYSMKNSTGTRPENNSNSSKPKSVTGPVAMNNNKDVFEYREYNSYRK